MDRYFLGCLDAKPHLVSPYFHHNDRDVVIDDDTLVLLSGKNQHFPFLCARSFRLESPHANVVNISRSTRRQGVDKTVFLYTPLYVTLPISQRKQSSQGPNRRHSGVLLPFEPDSMVRCTYSVNYSTNGCSNLYGSFSDLLGRFSGLRVPLKPIQRSGIFWRLLQNGHHRKTSRRLANFHF